MELAERPEGRLAARVLPPPLRRALQHVFAQDLDGMMLAGGTALAGYYAGHRRSDDLDLFTDGPVSQSAAVLAVRSLPEVGCSLLEEWRSAHLLDCTCRLDGHHFTVQVIRDAHLFSVGSGFPAEDGVLVADLPTLLKMKAATLVSRASEKDLYDLAWFFDRDETLDVPALLALGAEVDGGVNAEAALISLVGAALRESACGFSLSRTPREVLSRVDRVRNSLIDGVETHLRGQPPPTIAALIRKLG